MKIKIAVCIPAFSNAENVKNCIESIFKSNNEKFELTILLYNNSTKQDIISICKEYAFKFNNIQLQDIRCNRGCSITWNDAIEYVYHSKSNFFSSLIVINDDIQFFEDSFIYFVETVLKNPDIPIIPDNNLRKEFDEIHLPRTKGYYNKKWDNPVIFNGFPTRYLWPFDRKEESLKINYSQRKKPHPYFSTVVDIPYAFERFEEIKKNSSDINELVEDIFNHTKGCNIAVSLGIMKGDAAFALLLGCQHHISIDSNASRDTLNFLNDYFGSKSSSIIQNTYDPIDLEEFDVLFVDSAHTADCVEKELKTHAYKVNKFIIFHDTHTFGDVGEDGGEGIKKPIYDFLSKNQEWKIIYEINHNNGMIIIGK